MVIAPVAVKDKCKGLAQLDVDGFNHRPSLIYFLYSEASMQTGFVDVKSTCTEMERKVQRSGSAESTFPRITEMRLLRTDPP
jgi:hypothetical protein